MRYVERYRGKDISKMNNLNRFITPKNKFSYGEIIRTHYTLGEKLKYSPVEKSSDNFKGDLLLPNRCTINVPKSLDRLSTNNVDGGQRLQLIYLLNDYPNHTVIFK